MTAALNVLIASPLEAEHASRISAADPRVNLLYEPELLPVPRYPCDHTGTPPDLVARVLAAVGVEVCGAGRPGRSYQVPGVSQYVPDSRISDVLGSVDAVILACPLTERTHHLISSRELALLRPGSVLVNLSRGQVVDESALIGALAAGRLGGACLDVFETEPLPSGSPLWAMDNVIISPHSASTVPAENRLLTDLFIDNIGRWLAGEPLRNGFDTQAGD